MAVAVYADQRVTYDEVRAWAVWLRIFTASDLAEAMAVNVAVAERGIKALLWHGICYDTDDSFRGERIIAYVPLPPGPTEHETGTPPEIIVGYTDILTPRGITIRIRTERDMRKSLSTPGARQHHKNRERAYQRQEQAREQRRMENLERARKDPKWKRVKRGKTKVVDAE